MSEPAERTPLGWWTISGEALLDLLRRVSAGESVEAVFLEAYANAKIERPE